MPPGGKLRLESGDRHLRQLLLEGFHRIAIIPHGLHVARGIQQCQLAHIDRRIAGRKLRL